MPANRAESHRRIPSSGRFAAVVAVCLGLGFLAGCQDPIEPPGPLGSLPTTPHPLVERDEKEIRRGGVIRMITRYNSSSFFIHKGGQAGFDYELLWRFARSKDLAVEVVIPDPGEDLLALLNEGKGDVVCAGLVTDPSLGRWASWTRPTNFVSKVLVGSDAHPPPPGLRGLAGRTVTVPRGDPFKTELQSLRDERRLHFFIAEGRPHEGPEDILRRIADGEDILAAVDDVVARSAQTWLPDLQLGPAVGPRRPTGWLVRENSPDLKASLNSYLKDNLVVTETGRTRRSVDYGTIYDRYFRDEKAIKAFQEPDHRPDLGGMISAYDAMIRRKAEASGLDWRMVAALIYQESEFHPGARSRADARGLMQVLPRLAGAQADSLYMPEANLTAGLRLLTGIYGRYAYLDSLDRWRFTLAEYHAGHGHLTDARRIAMEMGRDPNAWEGAMVAALPRLRIRKYYETTRHGFYDGAETVDYVEEILNRYRVYMRLVARDPDAERAETVHHAAGPALPDPGRAPPP